MAITKEDGRRKGDDPRKVIDMPKAISEAFLSLPSFHPIPEIVGVCEAPLLDPQGREYSKPGYHPEIKVLLVAADEVKPAKGVAGRARAVAGLKKLRKLLRGFLFKTEADEAAAIAAILTALNRKSMPSAPMFQITAPAAGTGKSKLVDVVSIIVVGRPAAVLAIGRDENEFTKRLTGVLAQGDPIITLDNITREFGREDLLLQSLTQTTVLLRLLGGSGIMRAPTLTTFFATGNNLRPVSDLKRRSCLVRMDAGVERPEHRVFDFDVLQEAADQRAELIRAALDISKAYLEAGAPEVMVKDKTGKETPLKPAGSFEIWDRMVRRPLVWIGMPDPLESAETLRELDPDLEATAMLVEAWYRIFQDNAIKASDLIDASKQRVKDGSETWVDRNTDLRDVLESICQDHVNARRLGNWLRKNRDFIVGGRRIVQAGKDSHANTILWKVERLGD
jgi:putative DNA primase/helicase